MNLNIKLIVGVEMSVKLKRCPFCGGEAHIGYDHSYNPNRFFVNCVECSSASSVLIPLEDEKEAIKSWNKRKGEIK